MLLSMANPLILFRAFQLTRKRQTGFAYLWVLLLIAFLGVGLTIGAEIYTTASQRDKEKELLSIGRQFRSALARYYGIQTPNGKHSYPATLEDLLQDGRTPGIRRHLRKVFVDPMTGKAEWGLVLVSGRIVGVHSLSNKTPIKQDGFEVDDLSFKGKEKYGEWKFTYPADLLLRSDVLPGGKPDAPAGSMFPTSPVAIPETTTSAPVVSESPSSTAEPLSELPATSSSQP